MRRRGSRDLGTHPDTFITVQAFAAHLSVADKTVMKWIKAGVLPAYQFRTEWRIKRADAVTFVERAGVSF